MFWLHFTLNSLFGKITGKFMRLFSLMSYSKVHYNTFSKKTIMTNLTLLYVHSSFNEPQTASAVALTQSNCAETLCCVGSTKLNPPK